MIAKLALGILGGMGPQATIDLQQKILTLTAASCDLDHLRVFVDNHPQIPDRIGAVLRNTASPVPAMQVSLDKLTAMGAACVAMPCVSAHFFLPQLDFAPGLLFLNMLHITAQACFSNYRGQRAGVLCSQATAESGLLNPYFERYEISYIYPQKEDQCLLSRLILDVKAGGDISESAFAFGAVAKRLEKNGADYFVLACTELPLLAQHAPLSYPLVDATTELAKAAIVNCGYELRNSK